MTQRSRTYLKGRFEQGDIPTGTDYADFIDSFLSLEVSGTETMAGTLAVGKNVSVSASVSARDIHVERKTHFGYEELLPAGTTQASAARAVFDVTHIHVTAGATQDRSVVIDDHSNGRVQYINNDSASVTAATIYPAEGCNFVGTAANGGILLAAAQTVQVIHINASAYSFVRY